MQQKTLDAIAERIERAGNHDYRHVATIVSSDEMEVRVIFTKLGTYKTITLSEGQFVESYTRFATSFEDAMREAGEDLVACYTN